MKRRNFLRTAGALSLPALIKTGIAAAPLELFSQFIDPNSDRVLVLVRLSGGNDGLNTLIGLDQLGNLQQVRPNVALPNNGVINLTSTVGLHQNMTGMKSLFDEGKLGAIQAVGYPNQNRSHFRSTDIWTTASASDEVLSTGWMGRLLDRDHPNFPNGYPNNDFDYPLAMTMGNVVSETCQGISSNFSVAVNNPFNFTYIAPGGDTVLPENYYGDEVSFVRNLIGQSNQYGDVVQEAAEAGNSLATNYTDGPLSRQLQNIAYLLSGGLQTKIFVATLGGFDTHSLQVAGDTTTGDHAELMAELSDSIKAFMDDLKLLGLSHRVLGMTFSEFGRRIRSNQSNGTDHGDAGPLFLFGDCVQGGVLGSNPEIDLEVAQNVGVPFQYDFRDVYGSVLVDWFRVPRATVSNLISGGFTYLPLANRCNELREEVDVVDITATELDREIWIDWSVTGGSGPLNGGFLIERSTDGRNFRQIGRQGRRPTAGNSVSEYHFTDKDVREGPLYYYRIRQTTPAGGYEYSPIQTARLRGTALGDWAVGLVRPNPISERSYVKVFAPVDSKVSWEIFNASGQRVSTGSTALPGRMDTRIGLEGMHLRPGAYVWRLTTERGEQFTRKFIR